MNANTTIVTHHTALLELLASARCRQPDDKLIALLDAAMAQLALEAAALRALAEHAQLDTREHQVAHGRARLALFRVATSPSDSSVLEAAMQDLRDAFGERARALAGALAEHLDARTLDRLAAEMRELC